MLRYLENVVTLRLDAETCNGCGMCTIVCPHEVFDIEDRKAIIADQETWIRELENHVLTTSSIV